ncbi:MAG: hypothetical protein HC895_15615 [Leptolyngbyaceae cyanobacterium SM1_3_5]|nr:hypothetical protein [Leptolyngbyaceae cyanobacterium SM1_3_5]
MNRCGSDRDRDARSRICTDVGCQLNFEQGASIAVGSLGQERSFSCCLACRSTTPDTRHPTPDTPKT